MLADLRIDNYALIEHLHLKPSGRLTIITGETGAGKSIMLGAIGLLLGNRADTKMLFNQKSKCVVEGHFDVGHHPDVLAIFRAEDLDVDDDGLAILRREITPAGKSRAFVNDTPVTLEVLRRIGEHLVDIHSQHDTLLLADEAYQLSLLDAYAGLLPVRARYGTAYTALRTAETEVRALEKQLATQQRELDYNSFLLNELEEARLGDGEQEALEEEQKLLENAEEIKVKLAGATDALTESEYAASGTLKGVVTVLGSLAAYADTYAALRERLQSALIEINDVADELATAERATEADPARLAEVEERLNVLYTLQRKHGARDTAALLVVLADLRGRVGNVHELETRLDSTRAAFKAARADVQRVGQELSAGRKASFPKFEQEVRDLLGELGMPNARLIVHHEAAAQPQPSGLDAVGLLFTANRGAQPQPIAKAASGGEFSRLMLSVKYLLADKTALPTIIFDEIDTGISGEVALKVARLLRQMAAQHQCIAITHLPQMAAAGDLHYFVYKEETPERTISRLKVLDKAERVTEIAQMIGGTTPGKAAVQSAKELLKGN
ncbi:MAG: DNA repair protein RecN [Hymenobacteraceae bacterium]|nr:DNA repair protein RecN [Hymenobacteraceae bacterium]